MLSASDYRNKSYLLIPLLIIKSHIVSVLQLLICGQAHHLALHTLVLRLRVASWLRSCLYHFFGVNSQRVLLPGLEELALSDLLLQQVDSFARLL